MPCERNELLQHVLPLLDALSGRIVTSLALYDQLSSGAAAAVAGSGKAAETVSAASADAVAKAASAVSKARGLGGPGLSGDAIARKARDAVTKISARVSSQLTNPTGAGYVNEALSGLTTGTLAQLAAFTKGVPRTLDTRSGRGKIALAARAVLDFVAGDEATVMAYAQLLAEQIRATGTRELELLGRIEASLLGLHELSLRLYDGPWLETFRFQEALRKVTAAQQEVGRVRLSLEQYSLFQVASFDHSLALAHEARQQLTPSGIGQVISPTGRARDLDSIALDALRLGALKLQVQEAVPLTGVEHAGLQDLIGALVGLEREWPEAQRKAAQQVSALEVFQDSLETIAGAMAESLADGDTVRLTQFTLTTVAYREAYVALLDLGPWPFDDTAKRLRQAVEAAPAVAAGATGGLLANRGRLDGWQALLSGGRLSQLLDLDPQTVTQAGVALSCFHSLLPTAPPKQRQHLQALVDRLENHRRIEQMIVARQDDLQVLYDESLDREMGELTGHHRTMQIYPGLRHIEPG